ncbi:recombinase family protein [Streptomyces sp. NPDC056309]|uniref:recombinase family protein n=1 Tax=unclassified Streptomyces TaxID=2593676 RepID=UPI0035D58457
MRGTELHPHETHSNRRANARCSTLTQELQSQLDALAKHGIPRDKVFSEKISTRVRVRPQFEAALALARQIKAHAPHCRVIFTVYEMKRLGRDAAELTALADHLTAHGLVLEMLAGPLPGMYDPSGALVAAPENRLGIRDRSIGLTAFAIAGREHEVAFLRLRDFVGTEHGMEVDVRVSKIKPRKVKVPFGSRPSSCPVRAWRDWKAEAQLSDPDDFAYKPLHNRWHTVMDGGLDPETIGDVITRLGKWAELDFRPTGHSPRRGLATSSKRAGNDRTRARP